MKKSTRVLVIGPLTPYAAGYRAELDVQGYSPWTAVSYLYSFARLSRWLAAQGLTAADLDGVCVDRFVAARPGGRAGAVRRATPRGTSSLLGYLQRAGAAPAPAVIGTDVGGREALVDEFAGFLRTERGLAETTIDWYRHVAAMFLSAQVGDVTDMAVLSARQVNAFVVAQIGRRGTGSLNNVVTALRALLRFFYLRGYTATPLVGAAPRTVGWRDRGPSRGLAAEQVARLLAGCDRRTSSGRRDFAILTVLARLGLRANEVATLRLEDVDWRAGEITVHGKGNRTDRLPLPVDVGQAIADYCRRGRPRVASRALFVQVRAPYAGLTSTAVSKVVAAACRRAGLPEVGAHPAAAHRGGVTAPRRRPVVRDRPTAAPPARGDHRRVRPRRRGRAGRADTPLAGKCGVTDLHAAAGEYLAIRRALGFKLRGHDRLLAEFIAFLTDTGSPTVTSAAALAWATRSPHLQPVRYAQRLSVVRGFAGYLHALDAAVEVPPPDLLSYRRQHRTPYLYAHAEVDALLAATDLLRPPLRAATYRGVFGLLAVTGMRVGEVIALDDGDIDVHTGTVTIREAKFGKHRRLPVHATTATALRDYTTARAQLCSRPRGSSFFVSTRGTRLIYHCVHTTFAQLLTRAGITASAGGSAPTIHGLRHSFAVATLRDWYRAGVDVAARLPALSAYMGHAHPASTYWYLSAAPDLLALAAQRLEPAAGEPR